MARKVEFNPQPVQMKFLEAEERIVFFGGGGGGGKTWSILVDNLQGVHDPAYFSVFFRTTITEITQSLWPEAKLLYEPLLKDENGKYIGKAKIDEKGKTITFPSGARTCFAYLQYDKDADAWYGTELTKIYFDEFQFRSSYQFDLLRSRNRSRANVRKGIRCTLNPDSNHFVYDWVKPFLDEDGFPIKELSGKTRYFVIVEGELFTSWDLSELKDKYGKNPQTYTYIPATLEDNKILQEMDPEYKDNLDSMSEKKRKQLLLGCWSGNEDTGMYFRRTWLGEATHLPFGVTTVRAYDIGYSEPTQNYPYPDYTASIKMSKDKDGYIYVWGDYIEEFGDPKTAVKGRCRKSPGDRDNIMLKQAKHDGEEVKIVLPKEGAGGKENFMQKVKMFQAEGFHVVADPMAQNAPKLQRFERFSSAAESGIVKFLPHTFNKATWDMICAELELFDGISKSTSRRHDDMVDAFATAFNYIVKNKVIPSFSLGTAATSSQTRYREVMDNSTPSFGDKIKNGGLIG